MLRLLLSYLVLFTLVTSALAETYEVNVEVRKARYVEACVVGVPDSEQIRVCIDNRHYGIFLDETTLTDVFYIRPMIYDPNSESGKCVCPKYTGKSNKLVRRKQHVTFTKISDDNIQIPKGYVKVVPKSQIKKRKKPKDTMLVCVKC